MTRADSNVNWQIMNVICPPLSKDDGDDNEISTKKY